MQTPIFVEKTSKNSNVNKTPVNINSNMLLIQNFKVYSASQKKGKLIFL